jgi:hypothetical protein
MSLENRKESYMMWQKVHRAPFLRMLQRAARLLPPTLLIVLGSVLTACGAIPLAEPTLTPVATVAPNARALPGETTLVEAAPRIATEEAEATATQEATQRTPTDDAQDTTPEATAMPNETQPTDTPIRGTATPIMPEARIDELLTYTGRSAAVRGSITELVGEHAFRMRDPALLDEERVLVIYNQAGFELAEGQTVLANGEVRQFNLSEIEERTGLDLADEQIIANQTNLVLIADSVMQIP